MKAIILFAALAVASALPEPPINRGYPRRGSFATGGFTRNAFSQIIRSSSRNGAAPSPQYGPPSVNDAGVFSDSIEVSSAGNGGAPNSRAAFNGNRGFSNGNGGFSNGNGGFSNGNGAFSNGNGGFSNGNGGFSNGNRGFSNGNVAIRNGNGAAHNGFRRSGHANGGFRNGNGFIRNGNGAFRSGNGAYRNGNGNGNGYPTQRNGQPSVQYGPPSFQSGIPIGASGQDPLAEPASYQFSYKVADAEAGLDFGHEEAREGEEANGEYYVLLPDGRRLIVTYTANEDGYSPEIKYEEPRSGRNGGSNGYY